jgi:hypothetical protein
MKWIKLFEDWISAELPSHRIERSTDRFLNESINKRDRVTLESLIEFMSILLKEYDDAEVSNSMCTYVSGMIRWVLEKYGIESEFVQAEVFDFTPGRDKWSKKEYETHDFVIVDGKSIDFTIAQFFHKDLPFPLILDVNGDSFKKIYQNPRSAESRYLDFIKPDYDNREYYWDPNDNRYTNDYEELNQMYLYVDQIIKRFRGE